MMIWVPTWRCNRRCTYCNYNYKEGKCIAFDREIPAAELPPDKWIEFFRAHPEIRHLELTGGEPTLYQCLPDVLAALPDGMTWAITTNLLPKAVTKLPLDKCTCITASYHYTEDDTFFRHAKALKKKGKTPRVTIVITPENIDTAPDTIAMIRSKGLHVNLHPLLTPGWRWDNASWSRIRSWDDKPTVFLVDEITQGWEEGPRFDTCHLGTVDYAALGPGGEIYTCYGYLVQNMPMGHISCTFEMSPRVRPCFLQCEFPCDAQARIRIPKPT